MCYCTQFSSVGAWWIVCHYWKQFLGSLETRDPSDCSVCARTVLHLTCHLLSGQTSTSWGGGNRPHRQKFVNRRPSQYITIVECANYYTSASSSILMQLAICFIRPKGTVNKYRCAIAQAKKCTVSAAECTKNRLAVRRLFFIQKCPLFVTCAMTHFVLLPG